jgi:hypothetical protein
MDTTKLATIVGLLVGLSVASERLVEIVKNLTPVLRDEKPTERGEGRRQAALQILAVAAGILTAYLARPVIPDGVFPITDRYTATLALGLLASGGSGFWNSVLTYVLNLKDLTKVEVKKQTVMTELARNAIPPP